MEGKYMSARVGGDKIARLQPIPLRPVTDGERQEVPPPTERERLIQCFVDKLLPLAKFVSSNPSSPSNEKFVRELVEMDIDAIDWMFENRKVSRADLVQERALSFYWIDSLDGLQPHWREHFVLLGRAKAARAEAK